MRNKHRQKGKKMIVYSVLKVVAFVFMVYAALKLGTAGGNILFDLDSNVVGDVEVSNFKSALNSSFPIIDAVYNSGNISVSFSGEIKDMVKGLFGFDLNDPVTILNSQSTIFNSYYLNGYPSFLAQKDGEYKISYSTDDSSGPEHETNGLMQEVASSITYNAGEAGSGGTIEPGNIAIYNKTSYKINIDELLKEPLKINLDKKGPQVLIYHTHTSESYLRNLSDLNKSGISSWTRDARYNVVRVGEELCQNLTKKYGISVIHNATVNDSDYNSSYNVSLNTATRILKGNPSVKIVIDLHRDAMGGDGPKLRPVKTINNKSVAQVMFVMGTNSKWSHPKWKENLKLALKLQERLNELYPGLAKPINLSENRYNQHLSTGALIIEVGANGNTLSEALESTQYLAKAINDVVNGK